MNIFDKYNLLSFQKSNAKRDCFAMNDFLKEGTEIISEIIEGGAEVMDEKQTHKTIIDILYRDNILPGKYPLLK